MTAEQHARAIIITLEACGMLTQQAVQEAFQQAITEEREACAGIPKAQADKWRQNEKECLQSKELLGLAPSYAGDAAMLEYVANLILARSP